jgi:hypothetical protein
VQVAPELLERGFAEGRHWRARAAVERLHVGEGGDHGGLRLERGRVAVRGGVRELAPARAELARLRVAHVEPEDEPLQLCERGEVAPADVGRLGRFRRAERERRGGRLGRGLALRVDPHERRAGIDLRVRDGEHLPDDACVRRRHRHLDLLDSRATGSPLATSWPGWTGIATTTAGMGDATIPLGSRTIVCGTPSTCTSRRTPSVATSSRARPPLQARRRSLAPRRSTRTSRGAPPAGATR